MTISKILSSALLLLISTACIADEPEIVAAANRIITTVPVAVTDKTTSISGNPHNYESLSIYWWPDSLNPSGPYIARDGHYNPEYRKYDYPRLLALVKNISTVGNAYLYTKETKYYNYLCKQIDTWFINKNTLMLPNFEYCQFIPGRNNGKGNPQGLIDAYNFNTIIDVIANVDEHSPIGEKRLAALKKWMKKFAKWMETSPNGITASQYKNNQAIAYETTLYNIYTFIGKEKKAQRHARTCIKHISEQIQEDGKQPEELRRTKALSYSIYNIEHIEYFLQKYGTSNIENNILSKISKAKQYINKLKEQK